MRAMCGLVLTCGRIVGRIRGYHVHHVLRIEAKLTGLQEIDRDREGEDDVEEVRMMDIIWISELSSLYLRISTILTSNDQRKGRQSRPSIRERARKIGFY